MALKPLVFAAPNLKRSCKYGRKPDGYCYDKYEPGSNHKRKPKTCKYGFDPERPGYCNSAPADGRYGQPVPTSNPNGRPEDNPPPATAPEVAKEISTINKDLTGAAAGGAALTGAKLWLTRAGILALGAAAFGLATRSLDREEQRLAKIFIEREVNRTQRSLGRSLTPAELGLLTAQYLAFIKLKFRIARGQDFRWLKPWSGIPDAVRARRWLATLN